MRAMSAYDVLLDPDAPADGARPLDLPEGASVGDVADALDRLFASDETVRFVLVRIGGEPIGVANRTMLVNSHRGAPPASVDECPECCAASRHEPWCSAAPPGIRRRVDPDTTADADPAADARAAPEKEERMNASEHPQRRRWHVVYPLGRTDAMRAMGTVAAPLLAGFGLATLTLLITADQPPRLATVGMIAFTVGSTLFVFSVQFTCAGLLYTATPAERMAWEAGTEPVSTTAATRAIEVQQKDVWLAGRYFHAARWTYDLGILAHLCGLAAILVPPSGNVGGWIATAIVLIAILVEGIWVLSSQRGGGPAWLLPGYRHARQALSPTPSSPSGVDNPAQ